jgi:hypothetical protein
MITVDIQTLRQQLVGEIAVLPEPALVELVSVVNYLRDKSYQGTTISPQERALAFLDWAESHRGLDLPILSDEAISRDSIYGECCA